MAAFTFDLVSSSALLPISGSQWALSVRLRLSHADRAAGLTYSELQQQTQSALSQLPDALAIADPAEERNVIFGPRVLFPNLNQSPAKHESFLQVVDAGAELLMDLGEVDRMPFDAAWIRHFGSLNREDFWVLQQRLASRHLAGDTGSDTLQIQLLLNLSTDASQVLVALRGNATQKRLARLAQIRPPRFDEERTSAALSELNEAGFVIDTGQGWLLGEQSRGLRMAELTLFAARAWHR